MSNELSNIVALLWFVVTVFGWVPLVSVLRACNRRGDATIVLVLGCIYSPLMALFAFAVASGVGSGGAGTRGMAQLRLELAGMMSIAALFGLVIGVIGAWLRRKNTPDRRLLASAVIAVTLTAASLNLVLLFLVGPILFGVLALFAR